MKLTKKSRTREQKTKRNRELNKKFDDYNWSNIIENRTLIKLVVSSLNKYIKHNDLNHLLNLKKAQKIEAITSHFYSNEMMIRTYMTTSKMTKVRDTIIKDYETNESERHREDPAWFTTSRYGHATTNDFNRFKHQLKMILFNF